MKDITVDLIMKGFLVSCFLPFGLLLFTGIDPAVMITVWVISLSVCMPIAGVLALGEDDSDEGLLD